MIRVGIVDDHPVVRDGTAELLDRQEDLAVVATGATVDDVRSLVSRDDLDVVLLDVRLGTQSGLGALGGLGAAPEGGPAVVVLTAYDYPQYARAALDIGAAGFVTKTAPLEELLAAIREAAAGGLAFRVRPGGSLALSRRELDVVRLVVEGRSNDEIGAELAISARTVETHLRRLFERTGAASRTELATRAVREGWLDLPPAA